MMGRQRTVRILYMEDDPGLARLVQKKLERAGYDTDIARDGETGLAMYEQGSYDLVALDHFMPVYDGLEVIRILAARHPVPPMIMITGKGNERIAVEAMKLGARDYVVKDAEGRYLELLPSVVEHVLEQQRLIEEKKRVEEERERLIKELQQALDKVKMLSGLLPICASCKRIRDDSGYWKQIEAYVRDHSEAEFSHSICPECVKTLYDEIKGFKKSQ